MSQSQTKSVSIGSHAPITLIPRRGQPNVQYIFWSGGYSSTFRILQLLVETSDMIQPIFLSSPTEDATTTLSNLSKFYSDNKKLSGGRLLPLWHILTDDSIDTVADYFGFPMQDCSSYRSMQLLHGVLVCAEKGKYQVNMRLVDGTLNAVSPYMRYPCAYLTRRAMRKYSRRHGFTYLINR